MRKILTAMTAAALAGLSTAALASGYSGTVAITTDYVFRGISQSKGQPAIQGSIDYKHDGGWYFGVWGSNVDFNDGDEAQTEFDIYTGFGGKFENPAWSWDLNLLYFAYPGVDDIAGVDPDYDFFEFTPMLAYDFGVATLNGKVHYSPDFFGTAFDDGFYYEANLAIPLQNNFALGFHVGQQQLDETTVGQNTVGLEDSYTDYGVSLSLAAAGLNLTLGYTDTDLSEDECEIFAAIPRQEEEVCDGRILFTVSRSL